MQLRYGDKIVASQWSNYFFVRFFAKLLRDGGVGVADANLGVITQKRNKRLTNASDCFLLLKRFIVSHAVRWVNYSQSSSCKEFGRKGTL